MVGGKKSACRGPVVGGGRRLILDGIAVRRKEIVSANYDGVQI